MSLKNIILILSGMLLSSSAFAASINEATWQDPLQNMDEGQSKPAYSKTETFIRQYVLLRTTLLPDIDEMESRWLSGGDLQKMSSDRVYTTFIENDGATLLQRMKDKGITSNVKILTVNEIDETVWQVEYSVNYYLPSSVIPIPTTTRYRATLRIQYETKADQYKEGLKNPVGFKVISYEAKPLSE